MDKEKPLPEENAEKQFTENVQQDAELPIEEMKDTENKKALENASDIPKVQALQKAAVKGENIDQDQALEPLDKKPVEKPIANALDPVLPKVVTQTVSKKKSDDKVVLTPPTPIEKEKSLKKEDPKVQEKQAATPKVEAPEVTVIEDLTQFSKEKLVAHIAGLQKDTDFKQISNSLQNLKARFDELFEEAKVHALKVFLKEEGADPDDFFFKGDEIDQKFESIYHDLNKKKNQYYAHHHNCTVSEFHHLLHYYQKLRQDLKK